MKIAMKKKVTNFVKSNKKDCALTALEYITLIIHIFVGWRIITMIIAITIPFFIKDKKLKLICAGSSVLVIGLKWFYSDKGNLGLFGGGFGNSDGGKGGGSGGGVGSGVGAGNEPGTGNGGNSSGNESGTGKDGNGSNGIGFIPKFLQPKHNNDSGRQNVAASNNNKPPIANNPKNDSPPQNQTYNNTYGVGANQNTSVPQNMQNTGEAYKTYPNMNQNTNFTVQNKTPVISNQQNSMTGNASQGAGSQQRYYNANIQGQSYPYSAANNIGGYSGTNVNPQTNMQNLNGNQQPYNAIACPLLAQYQNIFYEYKFLETLQSSELVYSGKNILADSFQPSNNFDRFAYRTYYFADNAAVTRKKYLVIYIAYVNGDTEDLCNNYILPFIKFTGRECKIVTTSPRSNQDKNPFEMFKGYLKQDIYNKIVQGNSLIYIDRSDENRPDNYLELKHRALFKHINARGLGSNVEEHDYFLIPEPYFSRELADRDTSPCLIARNLVNVFNTKRKDIPKSDDRRSLCQHLFCIIEDD